MQVIEKNKFGKLDLKEIELFEDANDVSLPVDYKEFLFESNGGRPIKNILKVPSTDVHWIYGMHDIESWASLFSAIDIFKGRMPSWYMPIGCDSGGNQFIMSLYHENYGVIAFWEKEGENVEGGDQYFDNMILVADSFSDFLKLLGDG